MRSNSSSVSITFGSTPAHIRPYFRLSIAGKHGLCSLSRNNIPLDCGLVDGIQVVSILDVQPVLRGCAEETSQTCGRIRRDTTLSIHNKTDSICGNTDRPREPINADIFVLQ